VVAAACAGDDVRVVEPVTVWRVQLRRGDLGEREGTLRLEADGLVFEDRATSQETKVPFERIRGARRVKASPVLIVTEQPESGERTEIAYYFSQPPPLDMPAPGSSGTTAAGRPLGPFAALRRTSKRRHQRENVKYLTTKAGGLKPLIQAWADEIGARAKR
jgi:hypothetical protein